MKFYLGSNFPPPPTGYDAIRVRQRSSTELRVDHCVCRGRYSGLKSVAMVKALKASWVLYGQTMAYSSEEPRPNEAVAARWQYRGPCG